MKRALALLAAGLALAPATASAAERSLLVNGDSLAEGTRPYMSLGTNDDPGDVDGFRAAIADVMKVAGRNRCVVWANIVRPPYRGVSYRGYNHVLGVQARRRENLHVSAEGYQERAKAVARTVRRCR